MESVWALTDITKLVDAEFAQRLSSSVFANSYDGIVIADIQNLIVDVNPAYCRITGYTRDEVLGKNPSLISSGRQSDDFYMRMWTSLLQSDFWQGEVWNRRKTGEIYAEMLSVSAIRDARVEVQNFIGVSSDISSLKLHEQELDRFAHYDPLTGLPNRRQFQDQLQHELQLAQRTEGEVALILIDLDRFKEVNDTLGHDTGDRLLEDVGKRLQACVRESDSIARIGGDEFVVVMPGLQGQYFVRSPVTSRRSIRPFQHSHHPLKTITDQLPVCPQVSE
jgi:diguanylate cyclase (GGDEF)-like protein/PAS domain S-box-containing protein